MVSVFAVTAFAADCKVNDPDISGEYVGSCLNGLAHGKGKAKGRDTYDGEFKQGNKHGKGIYTWANGDKYDGDCLDDRRNGRGSYSATDGYKYDGDWLNGKEHGKSITTWSNGSKYVGEKQNGKMHGFGKMTVRRENTKAVESWDGKGKWIGDIYTVEGMFEEGHSTLSCTSPQNCKQVQANREAQERREAADRERDKATACNKYYNGYVGYVDYNNGKRDFWGQDIGNKYGRFVVLGSGGGSVSIKGVDGGSYPGYDKMDNVSCTWLREKER